MICEWWMVTAAANAVMVGIYAVISIEMIRAIIDGRQLRSNPLLTATAAVFITCTLGHGAHLAHALFATGLFWGVSGAGAMDAVRAEFGDPRLLWWDLFTAGTAIYFYTLRSRFA
ncbi:MAG: hybrid sensor histidine kinase/response regulator, partial [Thermoplasmatota archaeon]